MAVGCNLQVIKGQLSLSLGGLPSKREIRRLVRDGNNTCPIRIDPLLIHCMVINAPKRPSKKSLARNKFVKLRLST